MTDSQKQICPICHNPANDIKIEDHRNQYYISCEYCGKYIINGHKLLRELCIKNNFVNFNKHDPDKELSIIIRQTYEQTRKEVYLTYEIYDKLKKEFYIPTNPLEIIDKIMEYLGNKVNNFSDAIEIPKKDIPLLFLKNDKDLKTMLIFLKNLDYIDYNDNQTINCFLKLKGWSYLARLHSKSDSNQVFVAMKMGDDEALNNLYINAINPAITSTGFFPFRIDMEEHNEKICDRIIAEIKKSKFLIADFTGQSCNVYYEAGFAMGLGKPVIFCCRKDEVENLKFDTRQYNHILWENDADLKEALINRISATIKK